MHQPILKKLRTYRARIRTCVTIEGLCYGAAVVVGLVALSLLIDYHQKLSTASRIISLFIGLGVIGFALYRWLFSKLARPMDDERLALTVEDRFPELGDRLISSLQFAGALQAGTTGRSDQSLAMMTAVTSDAVSAVAPLNLGQTIRYGRALRAVAIAAAAWLILLSYTAWKPHVMGLWFERNVLMMNTPWPQRTHLDVTYKDVIPRGDSLVVTVRASGEELPERVTIRSRLLKSGTRREEDMARVGMVKDYTFEAKFKNVVEPLKFRVAGGDAVTDWFRVSLVERPSITQLKFRAVYPHYTRKPPEVLSTSESFLEVLPGTTIKVAAVASKQLKSARLVVNEEEPGINMALGGTDRVRDFWPKEEDRAALGDRKFWVGALKVADDCSVAVKVVDTVGLSNRPPTRFTVKIVPDKEPAVAVKITGIGEMIVPKATLPLEISVTDDYGITGVRLTHKFMIEEKYSDEETLNFDKLVYGGKAIGHKMLWNLTGLGLPPGSIFMFTVEATDSKDITPKNVGKTDTISLRVVTRDELMADLVRRQVEQSQDFKQVRRRQRMEVEVELKAGEREIRGMADDKARLDDKQTARLTAVEQTLRNSAAEVKHIADMLEQVLLEMINNKLGTEKKLGGQNEQTKLKTGIVQPLRRIADKLMPELTETVKLAATLRGAALKKQVAMAVAQNDQVLAQMDIVFDNMIKLQTFRRIVEQIRRLTEEQQDLLTDIEKEHKRLLESILGVKEEG